MVGRQDRVHVGYGNIVGQDLGASAGFATLALIRLLPDRRKGTQVSVGIDNVFDRTYAEHISRAGATVPATTLPPPRVNEPGRFFWLKASITLD